MAESDAILHEGAACVGPARVHSLRHGCNAAAGSASIEGHFTANAAHFFFWSGMDVPRENACSAPHPFTAYEVGWFRCRSGRRFGAAWRYMARHGLEKRSQNRLLKASDQIRGKR